MRCRLIVSVSLLGRSVGRKLPASSWPEGAIFLTEPGHCVRQRTKPNAEQRLYAGLIAPRLVSVSETKAYHIELSLSITRSPLSRSRKSFLLYLLFVPYSSHIGVPSLLPARACGAKVTALHYIFRIVPVQHALLGRSALQLVA